MIRIIARNYRCGRLNLFYPTCIYLLHRGPCSRLIATGTSRTNFSTHGEQVLQSGQITPSEGIKDNHSSSTTKRYRSRHYDAFNSTTKISMRLLEPHILSARLKKLCDANKINDAIAMLKNAPLGAQNTPVWNTMIWECMKAQRFQLAHHLYVDMKRRGHIPSTRTYQTMFQGFSRIENWSANTKQLANTHSLYKSFKQHITTLKSRSPSSSEISVTPLVGYIRILGDAGLLQQVFDVYHAMDNDGPWAPNHLIFTAIFQAMASSQKISSNNILNIAADARLLWKQMLKASQKRPGFPIDSHLVTCAISALSYGGLTDRDLAFQLVRDYFGLAAPTPNLPAKGTLPLQTKALATVLNLCNTTHKPHTCLTIFEQVKKRPQSLGGVSIIDRGHVEEVLKAHYEIGASESASQALALMEWMLVEEITGKNRTMLRPNASTFNLVLHICWKSADWNTALRTFELMTGYHSHDFMDGAEKERPRFTKRQDGRNIIPTSQTLSILVQTALATRNRSYMRQSLRIVDHLDLNKVMKPENLVSRTAIRDLIFFSSKLAIALSEVVKVVSSETKKKPSEDEEKRWKALSRTAADLDSELKINFRMSK